MIVADSNISINFIFFLKKLSTNAMSKLYCKFLCNPKTLNYS